MPVALRGGSPACVVPSTVSNGRGGLTPSPRSGAGSKSRYQPKRIPDQIGLPKHENVAAITVVPPHGPTIASHVRREYMKSCRSEGQHYLAASIGKLRISMQEQHTRSAF